MTPSEWAYRMRLEFGLLRAQDLVDYFCTKEFQTTFYKRVQLELSHMQELEFNNTLRGRHVARC